MNYWLVKTEPEEFSWEDHLKEGVSMWNGVRNFAARNFLRQMQAGDEVLFYYSGKDKAIVGLSTVAKTAYPDPTATEGDWSMVELSPKKKLNKPVSLAQIKQTEALQQMALLRISRLSVQPVTQAEFKTIMKLAEEEK